MSSARYERFENPETAKRLDELRKQYDAGELETGDEGPEDLPGQNASMSDLAEARETIASEDIVDPNEPLPDVRSVADVPWRGKLWQFYELGDSIMDAAKLRQELGIDNPEDVDENDPAGGMQFYEFILSILAEKSTHPDADMDFWRQFDLQRDDDVDDIIALFDRLVEAGVDVPKEVQQQSETFRDE